MPSSTNARSKMGRNRDEEESRRAREKKIEAKEWEKFSPMNQNVCTIIL